MRPPAPARPALLATALLLAVTACAGQPPTGPGPSPKPRGTPGASATPNATPTATAGATPTPGGLAPTPTAGATPTPGGATPAGPTPAAVPTPTPDPLRSLIATKLLPLAKISFAQSRGELAATGGFEGAAGAKLIGNNGAGILANNGAGILSNNGGGIVSNNGGGLITDNGAGIVANNGAAYGLRQLPEATPAPVTIATEPEAGEKLVARRVFVDGQILVEFEGQDAEGHVVTREVLIRGGEPIHETRVAFLARWPNNALKQVRRTITDRTANGRIGIRHVYVGEATEAGVSTRLRTLPGSFVRDGVTGAVITLADLDLDLVAKTGTFRFDYEAIGMREEGTLGPLNPNRLGQLTFAYWDPFATFDGESKTTDLAGKLLFTKRQRTADGKAVREFDLGDGLAMALTKQAADRFTGPMTRDGQPLADVRLDVRADGSSLFTVTLAGEPDAPLVIGYGLGQDAPAARPTAPPQWIAMTVAGAPAAGNVDGDGDVARFSDPGAIVPSRLHADRYYVADMENDRVRVMRKTASGLVFSTLASGLDEPIGLAVGPDETVYVSESDGHKVKAIAPDGTVTTLAGDGTAGLVDGKGGEARFSTPAGLAYDGSEPPILYVADAVNHAIRKVVVGGPDLGKVTTLAGNGTAGYVDAMGAAARFKVPLGLAVGPDRALYVADRDNRRIRKVTADGTTTTVAGTADETRIWMDGPALQTGFNAPRWLAFGNAGELYFSTVADLYAFTPFGEVRSLAGVRAKRHEDGVAWQAGFTDAKGLAVARNGVVYVVDGHAIRALVPPRQAQTAGN